MKRRFLVLAAASAALLTAAPSAPADVTPLVGSLHEHSGYSDGWPGSRPQTYYDSGQVVRARLHERVRALRQRRPADRRERVLPRPAGRAPVRARRPGQPARLVPQVGRDARAGARGHHSHLHRLPRLRVDLGPLRPHQRLLLAQRRERQGRRRLRDDGRLLLVAHARGLARRRLRRARDLQPPRRQVARRRRPRLQLERLRLRARRPTTRMVGIEVFNDTQRLRRATTRTRSTRAGTWARSAPRTSATAAPTTGAGPAGPRP